MLKSFAWLTRFSKIAQTLTEKMFLRAIRPETILLLLIVGPFSAINRMAVSQETVVESRPPVKMLSVCQADTIRSDKKVRLRIVSFNDFHGNYREHDGAIGAAKFCTAIKQYADNYPRDYPTSVCTLCSGDAFSGTALSYYSTLDRTTGKEKTTSLLDRFFDLTGVTAACIGNHEFDWETPFMEDHLAKTVVAIDGKNCPVYSVSNVVNKTTRRPPGNVPEYDVISPAGTDYKIAIVSLTTLETIAKSLPGTMNDYVFERPGVSADRSMKKIKDVDSFIFLTHMSSEQDASGKITFRGDEVEMRELLKLKPLAIITAHSHKFVSGQVDGVPIIQAGCYGNGLASISFIIDPEQRSIIEESQDFVNLLPDREHILPDPKMETAIDQAVETHHFSTIGVVRETLHKDRYTVNDLGTLVTKALATAFLETTKDEPVLSFQHGGGVRADLVKGPITEEDCFNILPFTSRMNLCRLTGQGIMRLLREGMTNKNGSLQCASLTFYYDSPNAKRPDFKHVAFADQGRRRWIEPEQEYWVALDHFIVSGGDGYSRAIFENCVVSADGPLARDVLARFFKNDLKGDIGLSESDRPAFVVMPSLPIDFRQFAPTPEALQKLPLTMTP